MSVPAAAVAAAYDRIDADGRSGIWITRIPRDVAVSLASITDPALPLAGLTLAVKGNIDVAGLRTTAGCPGYGTVARRSATAVRRLEAAGAIVVGHTDLDMFATGLSGTRSPRGACPNAHWPDLIAGGSSSGSAVAVAAGLVDLALGTDTAGSGRVPAAANGIVGLKPTRGRIGAGGVVPACRSLDCVSIFACDVAMATTAAAIAEGADPDDPWSRTRPSQAVAPVRRIGAPTTASLMGVPDLERFREAVDALAAAAGAEVVDVDLTPFLAAGDLLYGGAFVAERYEAVGPFVEAHPEAVDPSVAAIILAGRDLPAWQLTADRTELERLRRACAPTWTAVDVLIVPSVPRLPTLSEVLADPIGANAQLGTYTSFVNLLDLAALTVPVEPASADGPPTSITLIGPAWSDDALAATAGQLAW